MFSYFSLGLFLAFLILVIGSAYVAFNFNALDYSGDLESTIAGLFALTVLTLAIWPLLMPVAIGAGIGFAFKKIKGD